MKPVIDKIIQAGTGDQCLYIADRVQKHVLPASVKLGQYIIEKQDRLVADDFLHQLQFGKLQAQYRRTLLSL